MFKRILVSLLVVALATAPVNAVTMREVFDAANVNTTPTGASFGQAMNYYTGGSLFMRTPSKNYQLVSVTPPSFGYNSCGNIDAFFGGLSHISATEFVDMLKRIGQGAVQGFAFKLALSAMSPEIKQAIQELHDMAQKINKMNVDSCEVATGIVRATDISSLSKTAENLGAMYDTFTNNTVPDFSAAWKRIRDAGTGGGAEVKNMLDRAGADPNVRQKITDGNITWQAINRLPDSQFGGSVNYKYLLMSMIGPIIIGPKTSADNSNIATGDLAFDITKLPPLPFNVADLIWAPTSTTTSNLVVYQCDEPTKCKNPTTGTASFDSFMLMVQERMTNIVNNIMNGTKTNNELDIAFVNSTSIPVYKMLSIATQMRNPAIADYMIAKYKEAIAAEYAASYLSIALRETQSALADAAGKAGDEAKKNALDELNTRANGLRREVAEQMAKVYDKLNSVNNIAIEAMNLERALSASLPADLQTSLRFQIANGG